MAPEIEFQVGDAEALPFDDQSFDAVSSTFGVMFVARPEAAARELARVCRKGGRIGLATWLPEGGVAGLFAVMRRYMPASTGTPPSPFEWGRPERLRQLLGDAFELRFETGTTMLRMPDGLSVWNTLVAGFGPTKRLLPVLTRRGVISRGATSSRSMNSTAAISASPFRAIIW
jgi:SAM-dependent methyltransferase